MAPKKPILNDNHIFTKLIFIITLFFMAQSDVLSGLLLLMIYFLSSKAILPIQEGFFDTEIDSQKDSQKEPQKDLEKDFEKEEDDIDEDTSSEMDLGEEEDTKKDSIQIPIGYNYEDDIGSFIE
uniref:Uncharacterized protein n=1 Tax=viral metagenome TaxID=1070528 RepID=A0A6C0E8H9_9ZZZZ